MKPIWTEGAFSDWEGIARYIAVNFGKKAFDEYEYASLQKRKAHIEESERQYAAGNVYSEEESDSMMDQIVEQLVQF